MSETELTSLQREARLLEEITGFEIVAGLTGKESDEVIVGYWSRYAKWPYSHDTEARRRGWEACDDELNAEKAISWDRE